MFSGFLPVFGGVFLGIARFSDGILGVYSWAWSHSPRALKALALWEIAFTVPCECTVFAWLCVVTTSRKRRNYLKGFQECK